MEETFSSESHAASPASNHTRNQPLAKIGVEISCALVILTAIQLTETKQRVATCLLWARSIARFINQNAACCHSVPP
jgi:hypothetical protein